MEWHKIGVKAGLTMNYLLGCILGSVTYYSVACYRQKWFLYCVASNGQVSTIKNIKNTEKYRKI